MLVSRCLRIALLIPLCLPLLVLTGCHAKTYTPRQITLIAAYGPPPSSTDIDFREERRLIHDLQVLRQVQLFQNVQLINNTQKLLVKAEQQTRSRQATVSSFSGGSRALSHPTATVGGHIPYNYATWMRVHNCEQPETWHAGGHFGNGLPAGGNGLGFSLYAWQDAVRYAARRGVTLPASGWDASPDQQMQAAQAMLDATGGGPDCL